MSSKRKLKKWAKHDKRATRWKISSGIVMPYGKDEKFADAKERNRKAGLHYNSRIKPKKNPEWVQRPKGQPTNEEIREILDRLDK